MARPLVGITSRHEALDPDRTVHNIHAYDYNFVAYAERIARAGGVPVGLPNVTDAVDPRDYVDRIDVLLLSGGEDVQPTHYREKPTVGNLEFREARDQFELPLIRAFLEASRPVYAICRGLQALNVALGGTLYQDLSQFPNAEQHTREGHEYIRTHAVRIIPDSRLAQVCGSDELLVNTSHHQMIKDVAPGLRAVAWSTPDGIIEAVESSDDKPVLAVQWHPEMMNDESADRFFRAVVQG